MGYLKWYWSTVTFICLICNLITVFAQTSTINGTFIYDGYKTDFIIYAVSPNCPTSGVVGSISSSDSYNVVQPIAINTTLTPNDNNVTLVGFGLCLLVDSINFNGSVQFGLYEYADTDQFPGPTLPADATIVAYTDFAPLIAKNNSATAFFLPATYGSGLSLNGNYGIAIHYDTLGGGNINFVLNTNSTTQIFANLEINNFTSSPTAGNSWGVVSTPYSTYAYVVVNTVGPPQPTPAPTPAPTQAPTPAPTPAPTATPAPTYPPGVPTPPPTMTPKPTPAPTPAPTPLPALPFTVNSNYPPAPPHANDGQILKVNGIIFVITSVTLFLVI